MSSSQLHIYLNDHLALMSGEIELARRSARSNRGTELGDFLGRLGNEVSAQAAVVCDVIHRTSGRESRAKQGLAWMAEKLGRLKLNGSLLQPSSLSRVVELEALMAAAQLRFALWDSLLQLRNGDLRMQGISFDFFREQSTSHLEELIRQQRAAVARAFPRSIKIPVRE